MSQELAALRERHEEIREAARSRHRVAGALLSSRCEVKSFEGDRVEIGFQSQLLVEKALGDAEVLQALREAVGEAVGRPVDVVPVVWEALQRTSPQPQQRADDASSPPTRPPPPSADAPPAAAAAPPVQNGGHLVEEALKQGAVLAEE